MKICCTECESPSRFQGVDLAEAVMRTFIESQMKNKHSLEFPPRTPGGEPQRMNATEAHGFESTMGMYWEILFGDKT